MSPNNRVIWAVIFALFSWASVQAQDLEVIRVDVALVTVNVNVSDGKGRLLPSLKAQDFKVTDDGQPVALEFFQGQGPASIVFVVDTSSSMRGSKWRNLKAGLKEFLKRAPQGNDYTLVAFGDSPRLITNSVRADELWRSLKSLQPVGNTALYDAMLLGLNILVQVPQPHKTLILLSDGEDNFSRATLPVVQQKAFAHRTTIYTVGILPDDRSLLAYGSNGIRLLDELATATGGLVNFPAQEEVGEVLKKINADVSSHYSLGYYAPTKKPGWRRVQVSLAQDTTGLNLRYQQRYLVR